MYTYTRNSAAHSLNDAETQTASRKPQSKLYKVRSWIEKDAETKQAHMFSVQTCFLYVIYVHVHVQNICTYNSCKYNRKYGKTIVLIRPDIQPSRLGNVRFCYIIGTTRIARAF